MSFKKNPFQKQRFPDRPGTNRAAILSKGSVSTRGLMNKTEARYAELLEGQRLNGEVAAWMFESIRLRISDPKPGTQAVWYTPDFIVLMPDGTTYLDDVKGSGPENDAAVLRLKLAADRFKLWRFRKAKERKEGEFVLTEM